MWSIEQDDNLPSRRAPFHDALGNYIEDLGWSSRTLASETYIPEYRIKEIRTGRGKQVTSEEIYLMGVVMNLTYDQVKALMDLGGAHLTSEYRHQVMDKLLKQYEGSSLNFYNDFLKRMKLLPINAV